MTTVTLEVDGLVYPVSEISAEEFGEMIQRARENYGEVVGYPAYYCMDGGVRLYPHPTAGVTIRIIA